MPKKTKPMPDFIMKAMKAKKDGAAKTKKPKAAMYACGGGVKKKK